MYLRIAAAAVAATTTSSSSRFARQAATVEANNAVALPLFLLSKYSVRWRRAQHFAGWTVHASFE